MPKDAHDQMIRVPRTLILMPPIHACSILWATHWIPCVLPFVSQGVQLKRSEKVALGRALSDYILSHFSAEEKKQVDGKIVDLDGLRYIFFSRKE
jgi:hypothetical protein